MLRLVFNSNLNSKAFNCIVFNANDSLKWEITVLSFLWRIKKGTHTHPKKARDTDSSSHSIYKINKINGIASVCVCVRVLFEIISKLSVWQKRFSADWTINKWLCVLNFKLAFEFDFIVWKLFRLLISHTYPTNRLLNLTE